MGKVNFYDGMRVSKEHLEHLQSALHDAVRDVRETLGLGTVCRGLKVTAKDSNLVSVSPGLAFDREGNRIFVDEPVNIPVTLDQGQEVAYLYIKYEPIEKSLEDGTPTIISDGYGLSLEQAALTEEDNAVLLAGIKRSPDSSLIIDLSDVTYLVPSRHRHTGAYYSDEKGDWRFDGEKLEVAPLDVAPREVAPPQPAPLMRSLSPDYDSDFVPVSNNDKKLFQHSLHSFGLLVQIQRRSEVLNPGNLGLGQDYWYELTDPDNLVLHNNIAGNDPNEFRVMLWRVGREVKGETVPDVTALTRFMAETTLRSGGWKYTIEPSAPDEPGAKIGRVSSQSPSPGTLVIKESIALNLKIALFDYAIEAIEGIGERFGGRFRSLDPPVDTLQKLSLADKTSVKVPGVSAQRLGTWINMAVLMTTIENLDGNAAEVLVRAGISSPDLLTEKGTAEEFEAFYQKCLETAKVIRLPREYLSTYFTRDNLRKWIEKALLIVNH